ncbi:MAG: hypothetical protein EPN93_02295 [Spirochaetes bacterium]|nr:MAG: hypothetical protein EPN93_02295 [Spirochaetota bacterium]
MKTDLTIFAVFLLVIALSGCSIDSPVGEEYFNDLDKVDGGEKPGPPNLLSASVLDDKLTLTFNTDPTDGIPVPVETLDPETGTNDNLYYLVYYWDQDPATGLSEPEYYSVLYYIGYVRESDYTDPDTTNKGVTFFVNPAFSGRLWFWMTSYDGGRESDHSNVEFVDVP